MPEIQDIIESPEKAPFLLAWQWLAIIITCALITFAVYSHLRKKRNTTTPVDNLKDALERLEKIRLIEEGDATKQSSNQFTSDLSLLVREYLQGQFQNKSIFQTHEEFILDHQDLQQLPDSASDKLSSYLSALADHKYSPTQDLPTEKTKLIKLTETLLKGIDSTIPKKII